jgi:dienelactone hydrolase
LVVSDIFGRSPFYENLAARLAQAGFQALVPDYFFRVGALAEMTRDAALERRGRLDENRTLRDLQMAAAWLRNRPGAGGRLGTVGFCMGGTLVLDLTTIVPDLATVCYYGFPGRSVRPTQFTPPSPLDVVESMRGPILGFWGDQDAPVGMENVALLAAALEERGTPFEHTIYPGLGHGFLSASQFDPNHAAYEAACDSWTRAISFVRANLGSA